MKKLIYKSQKKHNECVCDLKKKFIFVESEVKIRIK